ncbi:MAG: hypothetical protein M3Z75_31530, partial [Actinomycetota bacterium]|nr:hypothetical protein [Actinomycetota bacterium]
VSDDFNRNVSPDLGGFLLGKQHDEIACAIFKHNAISILNSMKIHETWFLRGTLLVRATLI